MLITLRKIFYIFFFNSCLFLLLMIGIQNSSNKSKVNLVLDETIELPISFIVGISFICGSIIGGFTNIDVRNKNNF